MFNEAAIWPIPPVDYRSRVLKSVLSRIEDAFTDPEEDEILDDLMNTWSDLITRPRRSPLEEAQELSYIKYSPPGRLDSTPSQSVITSENRGLILSSGTTGFRTWEAALHLGTYLSTLTGRARIAGKNVVELGAGTGFLSMYCLKYLDANHVVATDRELALLSNIQDCVSRNNLDRLKFRTCIWEWGRPFEPTGRVDADCPTSFDVALGSDLIYDTDLVPVLLSTLHDLFDNYGLKEFIISATLRNPKTFTTFLKSCGANPRQILPMSAVVVHTSRSLISMSLEESYFHTQPIDFSAPPLESQDGFFHNTNVPIRTYRITTRETQS
ncbi:conserved hypothetical protein [Uncinocarpus reesii 1704]|uniref:Uncharacterized protein n=1 Tax=Uncinocarpus reesii (strain UAMH 1704) TaxID=336963 RepID=C4JKF9_UNCRE|nr:uncharacterized protein UREG_02116 [Uncinocarpus reesii 1704]EEP77267.1 conserved hypothetical protein [Uncinocarpus reesii 1704]